MLRIFMGNVHAFLALLQQGGRVEEFWACGVGMGDIAGFGLDDFENVRFGDLGICGLRL